MDNQAKSSPNARLPEEFIQQVKVVLTSLYDPMVMGNSPLLGWLIESPQPDPVRALRQVISSAIETLRPMEGTPRGIKSGRIYEILRQRFLEQQVQRRVAENIGMSTRQLQREEKLAIELLCDSLWRTYKVSERIIRKQSEMSAAAPPADHLKKENLIESWDDLEELKKATPLQSTTLLHEIQRMLQTLGKAIQDQRVMIQFTAEQAEKQGQLFLPAPILRQGLLSAASTLIRLVPDGLISISILVKAEEQRIRCEFNAHPGVSQKITLGEPNLNSLGYAARLIKLCGGSLKTCPSDLMGEEQADTCEKIELWIDLPLAEEFRVLFVEDNRDTLELYRRYLMDTSYQFVGASSVRDGFSIAEGILPKVIVIDVMMPEQDGWTFLSELRMHPNLEHTPVIVCSILQQPGLARMLGAVEFLHKPVNRVDLLDVLERLATSQAQASD